ncbi:MAG: 23S rRNA (guanosine(2251)-2'-O)-methyltransferase RlmB [Alphaproteobacteria bacterium]|nr:23S rRNA (guanosine(2251)-2'-O)-methyltransferase RlmB [Alphaproteobacteria bacterium]
MSKAEKRQHYAGKGGPKRAKLAKLGGGEGLWLFGVHAVNAALRNPARVCRRLVATEDRVKSLDPALLARIKQVESTDREGIDRLLPPGTVHQGLALAVDPLPDLEFDDLKRAAFIKERAVFLMLDQVTDPQNVGAVLRSAAAFGALGLILQDRFAPPESGALAKAASGGLEAVPLVRVVNLSKALDELKAEGFVAIGLEATADRTLPELAPLPPKLILVLGSEGEGMRMKQRETCDVLARLPMVSQGPVDSLNVSNAAAIALYEAGRGFTNG